MLRYITVLNEWAAKSARWLIVFIMINLLAEVIGRYLFNHPFMWTVELNQMFLCTVVMLGGGYAVINEAHIRMDVFYARFSPRQKAFLNVITSTLFFWFCVLLIWQGMIFAWRSFVVNEHSQSIWGPPLYYIKATIPIGGLLLMLQGICKFISDIRVIAGVDEKVR